MRRTQTFAFVTSVLLLASSSFGAPPKFAAREAIELPSGVVTLGDINGDGRPDIVAAIATPGSTNNDFEVSIELNNGSGVYKPGQTVDLGPNFVPTAIVTGDFNGDGKLDIAVLSSSAQSLYILLQQANGFVEEPIQIVDSTYQTLNMAVADLNGDHLPDIVIPAAEGIVMLLNTGAGHFAAPVLATTSQATFVVVADMNGDRKEDLLVSSASYGSGGPITVLLGDGHGGFDAPITQPDLTSVEARFAVADFNHDGKPDIAAVANYITGVSIVFGNGDGTFGLPEVTPLSGSVPYGLSVSAADLNGDGIPDIVALASNSSYYGAFTSIVTLINGGTGSFGVPASYSVQQTVGAALIGNLNSDTYPDILVTSFSTQESVVSVLFNNGKGVFQDGILEPTTYSPQFMVAGDFNGDGKLDVAEVNNVQGLTVFLNTGNNASPFSPLFSLPYYTGPIVAGDFNDDGRLDLVVANNETGETLLGNGDGTFFLQPPSFNLGSYPGSFAVADMNGDGKLDLVTAVPDVLLGNGDGTFQAPIFSSGYCYDPQSVFVADFNKDGKKDALTLCQGTIYLSLGNGDGTLQYPIYEYFGSQPESIAVGDFNRDGIEDIAFTSNPDYYLPTSTQVTIMLGNGDGTFRTGSSTLVLTGGVGQMVVSDFNDDGLLDVAVLDGEDSAFSILQGKGDGTFKTPTLYGTGTDPSCMIAGKFRTPVRPGFPDLAFCSAPGISLNFNTTQ